GYSSSDAAGRCDREGERPHPEHQRGAGRGRGRGIHAGPDAGLTMKAFLRGIGSMLNIWPAPPKAKTLPKFDKRAGIGTGALPPDQAIQDLEAMRQDWALVGGDMRDVMRSYRATVEAVKADDDLDVIARR